MISEAERRFAVRIKIAVPGGGFGERLNEMNGWLDQNAGADCWAMTPAGSGASSMMRSPSTSGMSRSRVHS
jgi:hypothetical protein